MIDIKSNNIFLEKENHIYKLNDDLDFGFTSVTTFVGDFFEKFDSHGIATKLTMTHPKYKHLTVEELLGQWKKKADYGTLVHEEIELYIKDQTYPKDDRSERAIKWLNGYKMQSNYKLYSEKIVYSKELQLAGTIDLLLYNEESEEYIIVDWKTSSKIATSAYKHKRGNNEITRNLEDCNFNHYSLQLSLYRYILETFYALKISEQLIVHLQENDCIGYHAPYIKNTVLEMIKER